MKILLIKPSSLGDVVHAMPVLRLLKSAFPHARIDWWVSGACRGLLDGDPDIHELIPFERQRWARPSGWPHLWHTVQQVRRTRYDVVIDLQNLLRTGVLSWFASGDWTVGLGAFREGAPAFYDLHVRRPSYHTHAVDWNLALLPRLGPVFDRPFEWIPRDLELSESIRRRWPCPADPLIAVHAGARWENKRWPREHFREWIRRVHDRVPGACFAILGGPDERELAEFLASAAGEQVWVLAGKTSLRETAEWLRWSDLLVTNDSGPMHIAAAVGTPVLAAFGPTDPARTGPYGVGHGVVQETSLHCVPCMKSQCTHERPTACLTDLTPERMAAQTEAQLARRVPRVGPVRWQWCDGRIEIR